MSFSLTRRSIRGLVLLSLAAGLAGSIAAADFDSWLAELREEAVGRGVSAAILDTALADLRPIERVIALDRKQPEFTLGLSEYLKRYVSTGRVSRGRRALADHGPLLGRIAEHYGVQPRFLVALWGIESNYGRDTGTFPVVAALATLAHDGRRAQFFRGELLDALSILEEGHIAPSRMRGAWAGAMGQPQFMPSSFRNYAVDFDGDGRRDIWDSEPDVLASAANYLSHFGWHPDQTWGRRVSLPAGFDADLIGCKVRKALPEWQRLGVRRPGGENLPQRSLTSCIVRPDPQGPAYVVYDNFRTLLRWNRSEYFGIAVGVLADRIAG